MMRLGALFSLLAILLAGSVRGEQSLRGLTSSTNADCTFDHGALATPQQAEAYVNVNDYANGQNSLATFELEFLSHPNFAYVGLTTLGWCVDYSRALPPTIYPMDLYSSYDPTLLPSGAVDRPSKLPVLTYVINTFRVGMPIAACDYTPIEFPDIQVAVWFIIDEESAPQVVDEIDGISYPHDMCIVNYIVETSRTHTDYEPDCNDPDALFAVLLVVDSEIDGSITNQVIIAEISVQAAGVCDCGDGGSFGDPHFKTWTGDRYDFHGICDLVLLQNSGFLSGTGLDVHVRTSKTKQWSYISSAVLRIGEETFEVSTEDDGTVKHFLNKVEGSSMDLSAGTTTIGGFEITSNTINSFQREFVVDLGKEGSVVFRTFKEWVRVDVSAASATSFADSLGLMGEFGTGKWLARDKTTEIEDSGEFGNQWQVLADEPMLFHSVVGPQAPQKCEMPSTSTTHRRLAEASVTLEEAEKACSHVEDEDRDMCIFDVLATEDTGVAGAY